MRFGMEGYGFFWGFVEILHESGGYVKERDLEAIAYELKVSSELCSKIVKESGFFVIKKGNITSERVLRNLKKRSDISQARKSAAETRWKRDGDKDDSEESSDAEEQKNQECTSVDGYRVWFDARLSKFEENANEDDLYGDGRGIWSVRPLLENLMDELQGMEFVVVNRKKVPVGKYLDALTYFFHSRAGISDFCQVTQDVNEKARAGRVKNKQNYLLSALYNTAKMNGGGV